MAVSHEMQEVLHKVRYEVEQAIFYPPPWAVDNARHQLADSLARAIADRVQTVLEQSLEDAVQRAYERAILDIVERGMRPIVEEFARFRQAFQSDLDGADWWKRRDHPEEDERPDDTRDEC